jgi:hypothetical protein
VFKKNKENQQNGSDTASRLEEEEGATSLGNANCVALQGNSRWYVAAC